MQKIHRIYFQVAVVTVMLSVLLVGGASAFNEADLQKLKKTHKCPHCDLSNVDLHDETLCGADLSGANLSWARLLFANLSVASLSGADLSGATWTDGTKCKEGSIGTCIK